MKQSKFSETQVVHALKQADAGVPVDELMRKYGISRATFYAWRKRGTSSRQTCQCDGE